MANNRMYLCCLTCLEDDGVSFRDATFCLGKYYPQTGWYTQSADESRYMSAYNRWLEAHSHIRNLTGEQFALVYESQTQEGQAKADLLRQVAEIVGRKSQDAKEENRNERPTD